MLSNYKITPNLGFDEIKFGIDLDSFVEKYGEPEDIDSIHEDEEFSTTVLHYWKDGVSIFFVGTVNPVLAGVETDHPEAELYGEKIMDRTKEDIVSLMKKTGIQSMKLKMKNIPAMAMRRILGFHMKVV